MLKSFQFNYGQSPRKKQKIEEIEKGNTEIMLDSFSKEETKKIQKRHAEKTLGSNAIEKIKKIEKGNIEIILDSLAVVFQFSDKCAAVSIYPGTQQLIITTNGYPKEKHIEGVLIYFHKLSQPLKTPERLKELRAKIAFQLSESTLNSDYGKSISSHHISIQTKMKIINSLLENNRDDDKISIIIEKEVRGNRQCRENAMLFLSAANHCINAIKRIEENILNKTVYFDFLNSHIIKSQEKNIHAEIRQLIKLIEMGFFTDSNYENIRTYIATSKTCCLDCYLFLKAVKETIETQENYKGGNIWFGEDDSHLISFDKWELPLLFSEDDSKEVINEETNKENLNLTNLKYHTRSHSKAFEKNYHNKETKLNSKEFTIESFEIQVLKKYYQKKKEYFINRTQDGFKKLITQKIIEIENGYSEKLDNLESINNKISELNNFMKATRSKKRPKKTKFSQNITKTNEEKTEKISNKDFDELEHIFCLDFDDKQAVQMAMNSEDESLDDLKDKMLSFGEKVKNLKKESNKNSEENKENIRKTNLNKTFISESSSSFLNDPLTSNIQKFSQIVGSLHRTALEGITLKNMGLFGTSNLLINQNLNKPQGGENLTQKMIV